jgi:hypothetical protein
MLQPVLGYQGGRGFATREKIIDGPGEVGSGRESLSGPGVVELPGVDEAQTGIKKVKIGSAGGSVSMGDLLGGVVEIGELPTMGLGKVGQAVRTILRITVGIVGSDCDGGDAAGGDSVSETTEGIGEVDDVGAVIAGKDDEKAPLSRNEGIGAVEETGSVGQGEFGGARARLESKGGGGFGHGNQGESGVSLGNRPRRVDILTDRD